MRVVTWSSILPLKRFVPNNAQRAYYSVKYAMNMSSFTPMYAPTSRPSVVASQSSGTWKISPSLLSVLPEPNEEEVSRLQDFFRATKSIVTITGAGISTVSGIPDYRGPEGSYSKGYKPMTHQDFVKKELQRKRYWTRSTFGWVRFSAAQPNEAHRSLVRLEQQGIVRHLITQNVDRLHAKAGHQHSTDLHGRIDRVRCMCCQGTLPRDSMQELLLQSNPVLADMLAEQQLNPTQMRSDGDMELQFDDYAQIQLPYCQACGPDKGILKPDVVLFGDNVPLDRVENLYREVCVNRHRDSFDRTFDFISDSLKL